MNCMLPTKEPLSRNSLDETFVWILDDEKGTAGAANVHEPRGRSAVGVQTLRFALGGFAERKHRR